MKQTLPTVLNALRSKITTLKKASALLVMLLLFSGSVVGQIGVTITNQANTTPNLAATYVNFTAFVTALNGVTAVSGSVTATLSAGTTETAPAKGFNISTSTANVFNTTNTLTIIKAAGAATTINAAVGSGTSSSASPDGLLYLRGMDGVTIDGLTFTDGNTASATVAMEFGIAFFKRAAGDGCNGNTIQNCVFNMQRINNSTGSLPLFDGSWAIEVLNSTATAATTALTPTNGGTLATNGTNSSNKFYSNTCNGGNGGIGLSGYTATSGVGPAPVATTFLGDLENIIGASTLGNSILNFGGGAATNPSAGIRANNQWSLNVNYNIINNNNGSGVNHATSLRGVFLQAGTSAKASCSNNSITLSSGATTSLLTAIDNVIGATAVSTNTIDINNNTIRFSYTTATSGVFGGILNTASAGTVNINNNDIQQNTSTNYPSTGTILAISGGSPGGPLNINNNIISNFNMTGASGILRAIAANTPIGLFSVTENTIENLRYATATSTGSITGIYNVASATLENFNNNIIRNFSTPTTGTLNGIQNNTTSGTFQCKNNQIYNFSTTAGGAGGFTANGITWSNANVDISGNFIYSIKSTGSTGGTGGTITGITHSGAANVYKNTIYDLASNSTNVTVTGINIAATGTNNVYNNLVGDLRAPFSTGNVSISGITSAGGTTNNIYFNTVNLAATTSSASTFGTSAIYFSSASPVNNLRNNIFVNTSAAGPTGGITAAIRYTSAPTSTVFPATNNNNFYYAGTAATNKLIYAEGGAATATNGQQTIAGYKTYINTTLAVSDREASSVSEVPNFVSTSGSNPITTFLQYDTTIATQIESGAATISGYTTDYAGTTRNVSTPDMGAWEQNGLLADFTPPSISYSALTNVLVAASQTLTATITDASGVSTSGLGLPVLYYKINSGTYTPVTGVSIGSNQYTFTFAPATTTVGDVVSYYVVAQDGVTIPNLGSFPSAGSGTFTASPPAAGTAPTTPSSYTALAPINGTKTVCASGCDYNSLTNAGGAFATINGSVATGNINLEIAGDLTSESGANPLNQLAGSYTLKIYPTTAAQTISGSLVSGGLIKINGADNITIDGSIGGLGTDRSLTINNTGATSAGIWVASLGGAGNGANNNTFKNLIIFGNSGTTAGNYGIISSANTAFATAASDNDNLTITNNSIYKVYTGISALTLATAGLDANVLSITNNSIGTSSAADYVTNRGIEISYATNPTIDNNTIFNIITSAGVNNTGINIDAGVVNGTVNGNIIKGLRSTNTGGFGSYGINFSSAVGTSGVVVANNLISDILTSNYSATSSLYNAFGIRITGGNSLKIYYNTINLFGTPSTGTGAGLSANLCVTTAVTGLVVKNNIFTNTTSFSVTGSVVANVLLISSLTFDCNYNDFYGTGNTNNTYYTGYNGASSWITTLANWRTSTSQDANSISANPTFVSTSAFFPATGSPVVNAGTPIITYTTDILGVTRSLTTPTIGAYETSYTAPTASFSLVTPVNCSTSVAHNISLTGTAGTGALTSATVTYTVNGGSTNTVTLSQTGSTWTGTIPVVTPTNAAVAYSYYVTDVNGITSTMGSGSYTDNGASGVTVTASASLTSVCSGSPSVLSAIVPLQNSSANSIGAETTVTANTDELTAFNNRRVTYRMQELFTVAELNAAGLIAGPISAIKYKIESLGSGSSTTSFVVKLGSSALTALTDYVATTTFTTTFPSASYTHAIGLNTLTFSNPYIWDGISNIIIDISHGGADSINNARTFYSTTSGTMTAFGYDGATVATMSLKRPNVIFVGTVASLAPAASVSWSDGSTSIGTNNPLTVNPTSNTTYTATYIVNSCAVTSNGASITITSDKTWTGGSGNWNTASNWSCSVLPTSTDVIIISSGSPVLDTDFTIGSTGSLTISGSGTLTINSTKTLTITGTANFGAKSVTIKSDSNGTGAIGKITGTLTGATNVTVERYIPNKRAWRALTAPLKGSDTSIFSQWQNGGISGTLTSTGLELWGPGGTGSTGNGLADGPNYSILQYDSATTGAWATVTNTKTNNLFTIAGNNAFMVFPTGPYNSGRILSNTVPLATTLKATGQLITGPVPYASLSSTSHTLIGNPYASPIDLNSILDANSTLEKYFWVWDPNGANQGTYNSFDATANTYTFTDVSYSNSTVIQSGQAFFVKALTGTGSFTINENDKSSSSTSNVFRNNNPAELLRVGLYKQENTQWSARDGAMSVFLADADANQTPNKMANGSENVAFTKNEGLFASNHHLPLVASDVLNVRVWNTTAGANYKLKINTEQFTTTNLDATLEDLFTNSRTPLTLNGTAVEYPFAVTTEAASTGNRFRIVFETNALGIINPKATGISIVPNPITGDTFQVNLGTLSMGIYSYSICNALGQEVEKGSINNVAQNTSYSVKFKNNTAAGIYIMKVTGTDNTVFTAKIIKK